VMCAGTFATWYFLAPNLPENPTWNSLKRAITTSFGSVCLGSLFTITKSSVFPALKRENRCRPLWGCFAWFLQYFNRNAMASVAIFGKPYFEAAKSAWDTLSMNGFAPILLDDMSNAILSLSCVFGASICALCGGIVGHYLSPIGFWWFPWVVAIFGFFIGLSIMIISTEVADAGVATLFLCLASEPQRLEQADPVLYAFLRDNYAAECPSFFSSPSPTNL